MEKVVNKKIFKNINLSSITLYKFPITAITSILHRITGIFLVLFLPFILWFFYLSMDCEENFYYIKIMLTDSYYVIFSWFVLSVLSYHILAGVRHLIMDFGFGDSMTFAKISSIFTLIISTIIAVMWGIWLCL